jgi:hypothetical protein
MKTAIAKRDAAPSPEPTAMRFREMLTSDLPESYVLIGVYGGTSTFPLCTFFVLRNWWEGFRVAPEISFEDAK